MRRLNKGEPSELRRIRTAVDELRNVDVALTDKSRHVTQALEAGTTSTSLREISEPLPGTERGHEETDAYQSQIDGAAKDLARPPRDYIANLQIAEL